MSDRENWEIFEAIFKDQARPYFELNGPINVYLVNPDTTDSKDRTMLTQLWFGGLGSRSDLYGDDRYLDDGGGLRGVLESGEADAPKNEGGQR